MPNYQLPFAHYFMFERNVTEKPDYSTDELAAWDREFVWHPFTPMKAWVEDKEIVVVERGEGEWLIDTEGRRYIDATSSIWCNVHGHGVPELDEAVREQLGKIAHTTLLGLASPPSILLAKKLVELMRARGMGLEKVFYTDDGSTAVEVACKMAYQFWRNEGSVVSGQWSVASGQGGERRRFLALTEAYHGGLSWPSLPPFPHGRLPNSAASPGSLRFAQRLGHPRRPGFRPGMEPVRRFAAA